MNLQPLFEIQRKLDEKIVKKKGLEGRNILPEMFLALQVEIGECANEWRGFKVWSNDQKPRLRRVVSVNGFDTNDNPKYEYENPLLEEYVDGLHFFLIIALGVFPESRIEFISANAEFKDVTQDVLSCFDHLFYKVGEFHFLYKNHGAFDEMDVYFSKLLTFYFGLGKSLGFSWEQIEQAYLDKNKINHTRQESGY